MVGVILEPKRSPRPGRYLRLQVKLAQEPADGELSRGPALLSDLDGRLLELEKKFASFGCRKNCADIKLERARIKR